MSCSDQPRMFVYAIVDFGSGGDGPQRPPSIVVDRTSMIAKSVEEVKKRALYALAQADATAGGALEATSARTVRGSVESLEVLVQPFPG